MTVQMTIVGTGQIGASMGLALAEHKSQLTRLGHDKDISASRRAEKMGALDKVSLNLPSAVRSADIVLLSLPIDQIRETLQIIAPDLKEGAVVVDTSPIKQAVASWAGEFLPAGRFYVGLLPVLNPAYLHSSETGVDAARADLFRGGLMGIISTPRSSSEAIKLAADLTQLLGALPLFVDAMEVDGLMASTQILPQLISAALLNMTIGQPGWPEARKFAGRAYASLTAPIEAGTPEALRTAAFLNRENVLRVTDNLIRSLQAIRQDIAGQDAAAMDQHLQQARQGHDQWWRQRLSADWDEGPPAPEIPGANDMFGRFLGLGRKPKN